MLTGEDTISVVSGWNHSVMPVPLISKIVSSKIWKITFAEIKKNIQKCKTYTYKKNDIDLTTEFLKEYKKKHPGYIENAPIKWEEIYDMIAIMQHLLIRSEFEWAKPPVDHPRDSVTSTIDMILKWQDANVSYIDWNSNIRWGLVNIDKRWIWEKKYIARSKYELKLEELSQETLINNLPPNKKDNANKLIAIQARPKVKLR